LGGSTVSGAAHLLQGLVEAGVDTCLMNPGTSEMHFVAALDSLEGIRPVLALFEGVATGAADGFARMAGRPAAALLHLGPGLGNATANLHNARRAKSPLVCVVGDHASYHKQLDAPLESDIETLAANFSGWVRRCESADQLGEDAREAVRRALGPPGQVATLVVPADLTWSRAGVRPTRAGFPRPAQASAPTAPDPRALERAASALRSGDPVAFLVGGRALREDRLEVLGSLAGASGARLICETFPARWERGAGRVGLERLAYFAEAALTQLGGLATLVLVDAKLPVSFFAYPGKPSVLVPEGTEVIELCGPLSDLDHALAGLSERILGVGGPLHQPSW